MKKNIFRRIIYKIRSIYFSLFFPGYFRKPKIRDYNREILDGAELNNLLIDRIVSGEAFFAGRFGSSEQSCLRYYDLVIKRGGPSYSLSAAGKIVIDSVCNLSGFFPHDDELLNRFVELYFNKIPKIDFLGVWFNPYEDILCNTYCKDSTLGELVGLEPYYYEKPWSKELKGKKVLVVHPFAETIESQYKKNREKLFENRDVLPEFELITLKAVQSLGGKHPDFATWFDALNYMKEKIRDIDFDIALVGAGAYGLPLGLFVKELGKQAIHLGGALQILFGIKGARWEAMPEISKFFNEYWVRPSEEETPKVANSVEDGCYW